MIKVIAFDIGGVLLDSERAFDTIYAEFARAIGAPSEAIVKMHDRYLDRMLYGTLSANGFFALIKKKYKVKGDLKKIWVKKAMGNLTLNKALLKVVDRLRTQYRVVIFSNVSELRSVADKKFDLYDHFDKTFLSFKLRMQKPSKRFFHYALKELRVHPGEILFIDNQENNLAVARELGIKSIQFNNNTQLLTELARMGLV
jgi:putative hydrolase of the HAD superfamily